MEGPAARYFLMGQGNGKERWLCRYAYMPISLFLVLLLYIPHRTPVFGVFLIIARCRDYNYDVRVYVPSKVKYVRCVRECEKRVAYYYCTSRLWIE